MTGGLSAQFDNGLSGGINYRFIKDRPATEDNSIVAEGYFITDLKEYSDNRGFYDDIISIIFNKN